MPVHHVLHHIAQDLPLPIAPHRRRICRTAQTNLALLQDAIKEVPVMNLHDPATRIGNRLLDSTSRVLVTIPAAPPCLSKVFQQWATAWMQQSTLDLLNKTNVASDGPYCLKGQGTSAFVVQIGNTIVHTHSFRVIAHSSFDTEMHAANAAIAYIGEHVQGPVLMFIDNQATLKSLFSTLPHTAFMLSLSNCKIMTSWLMSSPHNEIEF